MNQVIYRRSAEVDPDIKRIDGSEYFFGACGTIMEFDLHNITLQY